MSTSNGLVEQRVIRQRTSKTRQRVEYQPWTEYKVALQPPSYRITLQPDWHGRRMGIFQLLDESSYPHGDH